VIRAFRDMRFTPKYYSDEKSRMLRLAGYVARRKCIQGFDGGNLKERDHLEDLAVDGRIILKLP